MITYIHKPYKQPICTVKRRGVARKPLGHFKNEFGGKRIQKKTKKEGLDTDLVHTHR